jgi:hypothetical protein
MLDRTDHSRLSALQQARVAAAVIADRYIPAVDRQVTPADNRPPELVDTVVVPATLRINDAEVATADEAAIKSYADAAVLIAAALASAKDQGALLKAFIADNPVIQTAAEAQKAAAFIEGTRRTLAAMEDERKPKVGPLNAALDRINEPYRLIRQPLESLLKILCVRWNKWDGDERKRREAEAEQARQEAEEAARRAQALIDEANDAIAAADVGACEDVGTVVVDAQEAMWEANKLDRAARRAERATSVRVASALGGRAIASRGRRVIVIDDPCAAIKAIGLTEKIIIAIRQSAEAFEEIHGELPAGTRATIERSI